MPKVTYAQPDGTETVLDLAPGTTVMRGAVAGGVRGIVAECGGNRMCATCHVYVDLDEDTPDVFPPVTDDEDELLDCTAEPRQPNSRLSCQLTLTEETGDVVVRVPAAQT
ncbi:(2Fe-2S)-binding protein [Streptomyces ipomoeae]|jgi:2Fe-2S ferredoxin|uniref:2Fe-2S iron-sulfur cluster binding domain protein n=2 Tax=Streptomyces ipomoeae TaxID=103232 RepID=L1KM67_9ACTN|nr:2Fe-2S iron-sulfur cluster-binding protein [Streptomyces ipomoeae]EKX61649.1 2Fe-2S iron-sulfur cluster binding domain protein [Streptomyces ipomoeae 91-03]MDX2696764.1 2Fe-2S iron-sulfur cluster-binding protein [Streptomyces ipomoeae]MDX2825518.1 2Fe-2S iron-sulfur cluster-binding protein [Streptomyces ipomoeae]MDX2842511.1 2Fe-2S iron-sulfur cluster-binding protein [Streptomyces ipomoeae]MDX2876964.1 2Fe-2S iron-sulfur cluster-binding protein [Streptomyces ipomoeae]